ncbi:serine/threonine dehydratase [Actinosynnema sp. NPDC047251]|uniref:Ectoine utilization protein n=1 Tax=Saccharothrix espanaensis (strain ATCC 51144 / DSM 44229 / JCM 9112 / NBRC 15066 / NRRL 15764) TaxID=1179773 RepID=K0KD42_SACES|nr:serine/threonine dehydratase [Saccharothrix espanaensis]CCH34478.1 Ectoine utilization protein [Saccharothrix espanaensis DSM 44229]
MTSADVVAAADRIRPHVRRTPLWRVEVDGRPLVLKLEHLQLSGSFKLRGAVNTLLTADVPDRVVTASGGNHGLGVATAARLLGTQATVYVPVSAPEGKVRRIEAAGAKLIRAGATYAQAVEAAREASGFYVEAYNDLAVIAGQGTVAAEVVEDAPDVDVVAVAVGGGGLAAGAALSGLHVAAVEPENCRAMHDALAAGEPVDSVVDSVASSALGASRAGTVPFGILQAAGASSVLVSDDELLSARDRLWEEFRLAVEPAAAVPFAAWLHGRIPGTVCVVLCGANTDWTP